MHSFLIVGKGGIEVEIENLKKKLMVKILPFEIKKIADIKTLSGFTKLVVPEKTAIVIYDIDKASEEAQNAFLKSLEEPQENLVYILTATKMSDCLPTITSRCQIIEIKEKVDFDFNISAKDFLNFSIGREMEIISEIKTREEGINFLTGLIFTGHSLLLEGKSVVHFLETANKTLANLKANGNVPLQLTNFVVNIN